MSGDRDPITTTTDTTGTTAGVEGETPRSILCIDGKILSDRSCDWPVGDGGLPVICCTDSTRCGSFLTSDGACRRYALRGCPLRRRDKARKAGGRRRRTGARPKASGCAAAGIPAVEEAVPV